MKQEDKNLLLKDLCARLPYGVIIEHDGNLSKLDTIFMCDDISISSTSIDKKLSYNLDLDEVKPYLYPLSSMTEEKKYNNPIGFSQMLTILANRDWECITIRHRDLQKLIDWFDKNHFDWRGLIPMGLANDATGLNIY